MRNFATDASARPAWRRMGALAAALAASAFAAAPASAQDESLITVSTVIGENFGVPEAARPGLAGETDLAAEVAVFFKNLELIDLDGVEGRTFFGAIAPIRLRHAFTDNLSAELGVVAGQDFGDEDGLSDIDPLFRVLYQPDADSVFLAGTLFQTHWAHQALFDDTNRYRDLSEQGLQVRVDKPFFKHDSWVNWRVLEDEVDAEEFELGSTSRAYLLDGGLQLDGQVLWSHAGGQISTSRRVDNDVAAMVGAAARVPGARGGALDAVRVGANGFYSYTERKELRTDDTGSGWEVYAEGDLTVGPADILVGAGYFDGEDFFNPVGDPLFQFEDAYTWLRAGAVWDVADGAAIELGGTAQDAGGEVNWSATISFVATGVFQFDGVRRR